MSNIKVLPAPSWLLWDLNDPDEGEMLRDSLKTLQEIEPRFSRVGWYYDRSTKISWYEAHGRAWLGSSGSFEYELALHNHRPLTPREREAIRVLNYAGLASKKLRELWWRDTDWFDLRRIRRGSDLEVIHYEKEQAPSG